MLDRSDYLSFLLTIPNLPAISLFTLFLLALMRLAPIVSMAPFFGAKLPSGVKMGLAISLAFILLPHLILKTKEIPPTFDLFFLAYCVKELFVGFILLFLINIPFYIAQSCGILIDFLRGSSALQIMDPMMQSQSSSLGLLYQYVFIVLFYQMKGPFLFIEGVVNSYTIIPPDSFISPLFFQSGHPFWIFLCFLLTQFLTLSMQLAAPSLVAILMAEMFLGITNRLAPQIQIAFLGMPLKSLLGLALLWAGWFFILKQLEKQTFIFMQSIHRIVETIPKSS